MVDYTAPTFVNNAPPAMNAATMNVLAGAVAEAHSRLTSVEAGGGYTNEQAQDAIAAMIAAGTHTGVTFSYNDAANTLSATVTAQGYSDEQAQDAVAALLAAGTHTGITFTYNDAANTLSASVAATPDATTSTKGKAVILGGTSAAPTVPWTSLTGVPAIPADPPLVDAASSASGTITLATTAKKFQDYSGSGNMTFAVPTGTASNHQQFQVTVYATSARDIAFNASIKLYSGLTTPYTVPTGKTARFVLEYMSVNSAWNLTAFAISS